MIRGVGLDLTQISRMKRSLENPRFEERVFTADEREYLNGRADRAQSAAGLFSAKEAVLKAMGKGITELPLREIAITHDPDGAPGVRVAVNGRMLVSITHMGEYAAAVAVWDEEEGECDAKRHERAPDARSRQVHD